MTSSAQRLKRRSFEPPTDESIADRDSGRVAQAWRRHLDQTGQAMQRLSNALEEIDDLSATATTDQVRAKVIEILAALKRGLHAEGS